MQKRHIQLKVVNLMEDNLYAEQVRRSQKVRPELKFQNTFNYKELLLQVVSSPSSGSAGFTIGEIAMVCKVKETIEAADKDLYLLETEWQHILGKLKDCQFAVASKTLLDFASDIENAPLVNEPTKNVSPKLKSVRKRSSHS